MWVLWLDIGFSFLEIEFGFMGLRSNYYFCEIILDLFVEFLDVMMDNLKVIDNEINGERVWR